MGSHVSGLLKAKGYNIFITSRSERKNGNGITYLQGNAKELAFITGLCQRRWDAIIDFMVYSLDELKERINMILESTNQYIFISSARVYADSPMIKEDSPRLLDVCPDKEYIASNEYAIAKAREENVLFDSKYKNWTIDRPCRALYSQFSFS